MYTHGVMYYMKILYIGIIGGALLLAGFYYQSIYKPAQVQSQCEALMKKSLAESIQSLRKQGIIIPAGKEEEFWKQYYAPHNTRECKNR